MPAKGRSAEQLGDEIFRLVQDAQGKGFVSDGIDALETPAKIFGVIRGHLQQTERAARIMRKWLKQYDEY